MRLFFGNGIEDSIDKSERISLAIFFGHKDILIDDNFEGLPVLQEFAGTQEEHGRKGLVKFGERSFDQLAFDQLAIALVIDQCVFDQGQCHFFFLNTERLAGIFRIGGKISLFKMGDMLVYEWFDFFPRIYVGERLLFKMIEKFESVIPEGVGHQ